MRKFLDELLLASLIVAAYEKKEQNMYPLEQFFPADKQVGVKLEYIKGASNIPVVLRASTYEDKATARNREEISLNEHKMPYFKEKMVVNAEQLLELKKMEGLSAENNLVKNLFRKIYDDRANLILGARARAEYLRSRLMCEGKIVISSNGVEQTLDYGFDSTQKETLLGTDTWDNADANIIEKINEHKKLARERTGITPNIAMTSSKVIEYISKNTQVLNLVKQINGITGTLVLSEAMVLEAIKTHTGITIVANDDIYRNKVAGTNQRFFDENKFVLFTTQINPGRTVYATTPQEIIMGENGVDAENVDNGSMVVLTKWLDDPVTKETIVDMVCLPSAEGADTIQIIEVAA